MIITRKIQVFIPEDDKDLRRSYYEKLYDMRYTAVKIANMTASHLFALDNTMPYLSDEDKDTVTFLGVKGQKASRRNAPYVAASEAFKGKIDMGVCASIQNTVSKSYQEDKKSGMWNKSLRSYKSNMPIPFDVERFVNLRFADYTDSKGHTRNGCFFSLLGIPFQMLFGKDRSNNKSVVERVLSGEYRMATSSIQIDDKKHKIYLLLCVNIPQKEIKLKKGKTMYAFLGVFNPIVCTTSVDSPESFELHKKVRDIKNLEKALERIDDENSRNDIQRSIAALMSEAEDLYINDKKRMTVWEIGTKEEFNYRRRQIQEAVRRCQIENKYTKGGKGRKRKCQALGRFKDKEANYVDTKLHTYSRQLVDLAIKHECDTIYLMKQPEREEKAKEDRDKGEDFVFRNWSYFGLKQKIEYKAKMYGIKLKQDKGKEELED